MPLHLRSALRAFGSRRRWRPPGTGAAWTHSTSRRTFASGAPRCCCACVSISSSSFRAVRRRGVMKRDSDATRRLVGLVEGVVVDAVLVVVVAEIASWTAVFGAPLA